MQFHFVKAGKLSWTFILSEDFQNISENIISLLKKIKKYDFQLSVS